MNQGHVDKLKVVKRFKRLRNLVLLALALTVVFRFIIGVSSISGYSMYPTLENGDIVIYSRLEKNVNYGDIIALQLPSGDKYVKRIVGLAGDVVDIKDKTFYLNGQPLDEMLTLEEDGGVIFPLTIPEGDVFTLGDNRPESIDSRFYGTVNLRQIQGILRVRLHNFSISKIK